MQTFANLIAIACVAHFCWSYYRNCYRRGYSLDVWHFSLLFNLFVIHIMLPFVRSDLNVLAVGPVLLRRTQDHVNEAYLISALGYVAILAGGSLWRIRLGIGLRALFAGSVETLTRASLVLLRSRALLIAHGAVAVAMMSGVLLYYFKVDGFGFNLRGLLLVVPALRPIAQFAAFYAVLIGSYCLARFVEHRERSMLVVLSLIILGLLFFGERGNLAGIAVMMVLVVLIKRGRRINLLMLVAGVVGAFVAISLLDALRRPAFSVGAVAGGSAIDVLYGNSFSDTRDFALVLSFWDGHYLMGRTYLAGLIAFVPRFLSTFRDTWAIGVVTATTAGYKATEHPGLRVGIFGEAYLNFGLGAVVALGLFIGATTRLVDLRMKQSLTLPRSDMRIYSYYILTILIATAENSSAASTFYSILLILAGSWFMLRVARFMKLTAD